MPEVNIFITFGLDKSYHRQIAAVDPCIKVWDLMEQFEPQPFLGAHVDLDWNRSRDKLDALLKEADVLFAWRFPPDILSRAPRLKWIQVTSTGVDRFLGTGISESPVILTSASGVHAIPVAEYVLAVMLMFAKQAPRCMANKGTKRWERFYTSELYGMTVGIVGLGNIGREVARLSRAFGMKVIATRRSQTEHELSVEDVDELFPFPHLPDLLAMSDFVVLSVPLTSKTRRMIGQRELQAMKPTAYLINIARGQVIDEPVLAKALKEGWIAGAGLDVFETEPLPADSELWEIPNVIISPHIAGAGGSEVSHERLTELFCENLRRYLTGQPLLNRVDKEREY